MKKAISKKPKKEQVQFHILVDLVEQKLILNAKEITVWSLNGYNLRENMNIHGYYTNKKAALEAALSLIK